ncbi:chemotaxis protein CheA [Pseudooceanicola sp. CBS1P-1]|uniref:Chemotaxis protein CheA n=1 Tax=Pseudooceanicola albus TaxID=2692189 RepID=A0A6L7GA07_9RHOB|nr:MULTISPECIES: chemotaxis protein CheA [Pseudooceanicola]MBT9382850.1 chemotaxis protein CheA [Pseudooceanicola endophyticus]MXN20226.1 chemotaxis protein CheA [Pseudooceanicola albus]
MSPLLTQFIQETRHLIEQASRALLALEAAPSDSEHLDGLFRAVHTVKGASGLFEIAPFTRIVHAGEDVLDAVRAGDVPFDAELADQLLRMLDQMSEWLEALETSGGLTEEAAGVGEALSQALRAHLIEAAEAPVVLSPDLSPRTDWPEAVPEALRHGTGCHLITYQPHPEVFYSGDDPLLTVMTTPGRGWCRTLPPEVWPDPEAFDPFTALLGFQLVSTAPLAELEAHFLYVADQVRIEALPDRAPPPHPAEGPGAVLADMARALCTSQLRLLEAGAPEAQRPARQGTARTVLMRAARALGQAGIAGQLAALDPGEAGAAGALADLARALSDSLSAPPPALPGPPVAAPQPPPPAEAPDPAQAAPRKAAPIRVDAERIDQLMNLAGELIVAKNAMPFLIRKAEEMEDPRALAREIKAQHDAINRIADALQTAVMQIRMVPVGTVLSRFNRLVRDLARKLDKRIRLEITGEETEADKAIVEELADPMVHLIRNAIDHGLETPAERRAAGKPEEGTLRLSASQRDDHVVIEIGDDGRGIDLDRVVAKALEKGLIDAAELDTMTEEARMQLIFRAGLSTRDEISDLSGRGVGMDVVASMVRRVGGTIALSSRTGQGTTVRVSLPLSMAVQRLMMIEVGGGLYGVAVDQIVESQRLTRDRIHRHRHEETILLRQRMIPLLRLRDLFGCPPEDPGEVKPEINIMVVSVDGNEVGLVVDRFHAGIEAVVKPMEGILNGVNCFAGTALLGDGSVLLALNLSEVLSCRWN